MLDVQAADYSVMEELTRATQPGLKVLQLHTAAGPVSQRRLISREASWCASLGDVQQAAARAYLARL